MDRTWARIVAALALASLVALPLPAGAGAGLAGYLIGTDGRAAAGYRMHLIDERGVEVAQATTSPRGIYEFRELPAGTYMLAVEDQAGSMAPVASPPLQLDNGELARRDVKLEAADEPAREAAAAENTGFGVWWAGLSPWAKAGAVIGGFVVLGLALTALDDDESSGSPTGP
jgi:hypothetical protein